MPYLLALDQGTTSSRAVVFDETGRVVSTAQREFAQHYPKPGWVEHEPSDLWETQLDTARMALAEAGLSAKDVAGIGIGNQRETVLLWDRATGEAVHRAIVWQDRRTASVCQRLRDQGLEPTLTQKAGLVLDPYFSATKLAWLLDHVNGARARAERGDLAFGTVDTWLVWHLTGGRVHATDVSNASRTALLNLETGTWDDELLQAFGVPREVLPEIVDTSGVLAETEPELLGEAVPIAALVGDQQAALFGQACFAPGDTKNTYGTGCFMLMHTGHTPRPSAHRLLTTAAWRIGGAMEYALEGSVFIGGAVVQWLRDGLGVISDSAEVEALAASVPDSGGVILVPAFAGLGAPHWDASARGTIVGLTRGTTKAHLARAALEGIAFQVADVMDVMRRDAGLPLESMRVDGGASANGMLMQTQADLLRASVVRPANTETTAWGAAALAGLALGLFPDRAAVAAMAREARRFEPVQDKAKVESKRSAWRRALQRAGDWDTTPA